MYRGSAYEFKDIHDFSMSCNNEDPNQVLEPFLLYHVTSI